VRLDIDYSSEGVMLCPYSKKDIFLYIDHIVNHAGLVQPLDKIVVRCHSHNLSLFVRLHAWRALKKGKKMNFFFDKYSKKIAQRDHFGF